MGCDERYKKSITMKYSVLVRKIVVYLRLVLKKGKLFKENSIGDTRLRRGFSAIVLDVRKIKIKRQNRMQLSKRDAKIQVRISEA